MAGRSCGVVEVFVFYEAGGGRGHDVTSECSAVLLVMCECLVVGGSVIAEGVP